jgi:RNA polymerase sigma-70 factor (ECF subfamily)
MSRLAPVYARAFARTREARIAKTGPSDEERMVRLHDAVLRRDPIAREVLALLLLHRCWRILKHERPWLDANTINDAVEDAVLHYLEAPECFDPSRARLDTFIVRDAMHRALHAVRADERRRRRDVHMAPRNYGTVPEPDDAADSPEDLLAALIRGVATGSEREFLEAKAHGEHQTSVLAAILGFEGLPVVDQRRAVKRVTDKLIVRMRRFVKSGELETATVRPRPSSQRRRTKD